MDADVGDSNGPQFRNHHPQNLYGRTTLASHAAAFAGYAMGTSVPQEPALGGVSVGVV